MEFKKIYSRQLDIYIDGIKIGNSSFKNTDDRTTVSYFLDENGLVHSNSFNYSLIGNNPISINSFRSEIEKQINNYSEIIINENAFGEYYLNLSNKWLQEFDQPTELSKSMTLNEIQEKVSNNYSLSEYFSKFSENQMDIDLFTDIDSLPIDIKNVYNKYAEIESSNGLNYEDCQNFLIECNKLGYTFEYQLDGVPFNLKLINQKSNIMATEEKLQEEKVFKKFTGKLIDTKNGYIDNQILGTILGIQNPKYNYYPEKLELLNKVLEPIGKSLESLKGVTLDDLKNDLLKVMYDTNKTAEGNNITFEANQGPGNEMIREFKESARNIQDKAIEQTKKFKTELSGMSLDDLKDLTNNPDNKLNDYGKFLVNVEVEKKVVGELTNEELMDKVRESKGKASVVSEELDLRLNAGSLSKDFVNESLMSSRFDFLTENEGSILNSKNQGEISFAFLELAYLKKPTELETALTDLKINPEVVEKFNSIEHKFLPSEERNQAFENLRGEINKSDVSKFKELTGLKPTIADQEQNQSSGLKR